MPAPSKKVLLERDWKQIVEEVTGLIALDRDPNTFAFCDEDNEEWLLIPAPVFLDLVRRVMRRRAS